MYAKNYTAIDTGKNQKDGLIPVASRWFGSWRLSLERREYSVVELTNQYDAVAQSWNRTLSRLGVSKAYQSLANALYRELVTHHRDTTLRVLECGAGTAELSRAFVELHQNPVEVCAVDISAEMLRQARQEFRNAGLEAELVVSDVRNLPFSDNSQDVVIAAHVLEHLADPQPAIAEMFRVLKPDGLALLCCTRQSFSGKWIQMKWRTHTVTPQLMRAWLGQQGCDRIKQISIDNQSKLNKFSLAFIAKKSNVAKVAA